MMKSVMQKYQGENNTIQLSFCSSSSSDSRTYPLPQPTTTILGEDEQQCHQHFNYQYVIGEDLESVCFPDRSNQTFQHNQLVWVCKSKGRKKASSKSRSKNNIENPQIPEETTRDICSNNNHNIDSCYPASSSSTINNSSRQRHELFMRARIVDPNVIQRDVVEPTDSTTRPDGSDREAFAREERVLVQYPAGSTYYVHVNHIIPILHSYHDNDTRGSSKIHPTHKNRVVVVWSETDLYRRCCMIHCVPEYDDAFIEIGCDEGELIYKMSQSFLFVPTPTPTASTTMIISSKKKKREDEIRGIIVRDETDTTQDSKKNNMITTSRMETQKKASVLGLDKSKQSIRIAQQRYPQCSFQVCDVLVDEPTHWPIPSELLYGCPRTMDHYDPSGQPSPLAKKKSIVIAIDINGNREIQAVLQCLQIVMNTFRPHLVIVKSRALHHDLKMNKQQQVKPQSEFVPSD
jgi:hypothetical protein